MNREEKIKKVIRDSHNIADKILKANTMMALQSLIPEIETYSNFVNQEFGDLDEFSEDPLEKYSELTFYCHMALEEKTDRLEYYAEHPEEISQGVSDFLNYLDSRKWL